MDQGVVWFRFVFWFCTRLRPSEVARAGPFTAMPTLIRIWVSVLDGESQVERDLAQLRAFRQESPKQETRF